MVKGKVKTITLADNSSVEAFVPEYDPNYWTGSDKYEHQGIYFDAQAANDGAQPDLIRIADSKKRINEQVGILETISEADFKNTEVLVFRESTGQLIVQRKGLKDNEYDVRQTIGYNSDEQKAAYRIMLRGDKGSRNRRGLSGGSFNYQSYASDHLMTEPFQTRKADHPKPGEYVKVVAINRATGYIGTTRVQLKSASDNFGALSVVVPEITLLPPNLKIWAERDYKVEYGATKDKDRRYIIGAEGAGLTSDTTITVYTEWLDHDNSPLPDGLSAGQGADFGFTGRLAKIVAPNQLDSASVQIEDSSGQGGSDLAEFPIAPGRQIQAINVGSNLSQAEHYYIHVSGTQKVEGPTFDTGFANAPYNTRPEKLTPFQVPLYFEAKSWLDYDAYRDLQDQFNAGEIQTDPNKPLPAYAWQYRPEYQFSQYDLEMNALARVANAGETNEQRSDILNLDNPTIASSDDYIEALYSLISSNYDRLTPIDGGQDLILALGEDEMLVEVGQDKTLKFDNIEHLASLSPEDFLTMRLYTNQDAGNVLWEYAFEFLDYYAVIDDDILPSEVDGAIEISADDTEIDLVAHLIGFANRSPESKYDVLMNWKKVGSGSLVKTTDHDDDYAIFKNTLTLPTVTGAIAKVTAELSSNGGGTVGSPLSFRVVPGQTNSVTAAPRTGSEPMYIGGEGNITIDGVATDQFGNRVADGTAVTVTTDGAIK